MERRPKYPATLVLRSLLVLLVVLLLPAAASARRSKRVAKSTPDCKTAVQCSTVPVDCCACSAGGAQRAIPLKQKADYMRGISERCASMVCVQMMSTDPSCSKHATCEAGKCVLAAGHGSDSGKGAKARGHKRRGRR